MRQIYKIIVNVEQKKKKLEVLVESKKIVFLPPNSASGSSSVGRAQPCQGWGREFESRFPLKVL